MQFAGPAEISSAWQRFGMRYGISAAVPFIYPPFSAVLFQPLSHLSYFSATLCWSLLNLFLATAAVVMTLSLGGVRLDARLIVLLMLGLFSYYPYRDELALGQIGSLILFLWAASLWLLSRNRNWSSAFCFAFATMIKLTPVLAIPLLILYRKWKWVVAYIFWIGCMVCFSVWQAGLAVHIQFIRNVMPSISCGAPVSQNSSIVGFVQQMLLGYVPDWPKAPHTLPVLACFTSKLVAMALYAAIMFRFYRRRKDQGLLHGMVLMVLVSLVVSPISWWHHYTLALLPLIYLWGMSRAHLRDKILLIAALAIGTNVFGFALLLTSNHAMQLILAGFIPLLITALIFTSISSQPLEQAEPAVARGVSVGI
ncbi:MAG: glycosyltransferase family 87 protein [Acidobacteriaceae bacterium]